ncbi:MAG: polyribonucleotide nucleotidyltransferase [Melioribacteraceae bacterium]|nr:polyribonucleotide nucleotidyltransferase [Melioribacteraceae bacterium]MCF8355845.1 polyribonucleotide nucleotidyltransferase [Melioribacteraceae bacterium]MCF8392580.1 polyribonucleotide nucleotidyltransferase [Melioribacteraceae bacterium]MCF8418548.1 polyribonucleotide nucleotidyltransferase [Melioribacteraceae bacterium]
MIFTKEIEIGGKKLTVETGRYAKQANGAVMVTCGETMVLVTAVASEEQREDIDFFPLSVEYRERAFAAGKIPGGFFKREGRPTDKEILSSRLIDRPIRPLFPDEYRNDTQLAAFVYSYDGENDADVIAAIGASTALAISDIPFLEPIGEVRVARVDGNLVVNPTHKEIEASDIELIIAGTADSIMMVEGEAKEAGEADLLKAISFAHEEIKKLVQMQNELREQCGKPKMEVPAKEVDENLVSEVKEIAYSKIEELVATVLEKDERSKSNKAITEEVVTALAEKYPEQEKELKSILHDIEKEAMRKRILTEGKRLDGRTTTDIRKITIELGLLPRTHGSALFTRGETQSLMTLTLGNKRDEQIIDGLQEEYTKRFMLHYNFPPFSVGETGRYSGVGRREVGHGNLAERALKFIMPAESEFPYTIRLNSDILESNGSSSMATVCSGSLALMQAGVPVPKPIAGIAMGLIKEDNDFAILSDILGNEDHLGDMDFKVAGSAEGITAIQMDIKIQGISFEIMEKALDQAKAGRLFILEKMNSAIAKSNEKLSEWAPTLLSMKVKTDQIGSIIGPGGKVIQGMQKEFNVEIVIEEDGTVNVSAPIAANAEAAIAHIKRMTTPPELGAVYEGKITKITDFGAFVEITPGTEGLLHISQIDHSRVKNVKDVLSEGEIVKVKLIKTENGKFSLSRKALLDRPSQKEESPNE